MATPVCHPIIRRQGICAYRETWDAMRRFTDERDADSADEIWFLQHSPVFTLGMAGKAEHLLDPGTIPVVRTDRGGQVTYHGPGQLLVYVLFDLRRSGWGVRVFIERLEQAVIDFLADNGVQASRQTGAPGVYTEAGKIAALGLRIRKGRSYHGIALNVDMDLEPFSRINPCGYPGMEVTQTRDLGIGYNLPELSEILLAKLLASMDAGNR